MLTQHAGADPGIFDWGGPNLVQIGLLDSFEANYFSPTPPTPPPTCRGCALQFLGRLPFTWILLVKDAPFEHPSLVFGYKDYIVQISSTSMSRP